jgi:RecB family endonuclease NucS
LKEITESQFNSLVHEFHASRPIKLPKRSSVTRAGHGTGEGQTHLRLKQYVAADPSSALEEPGLRTIAVEYEFPTNDRADIVLVDSHNRIIGVEIEPTVGRREAAGALQAIKYRHMLEYFTGRELGDSRAMLVAHRIDRAVKEKCRRYKIECYEIAKRHISVCED